MDPGEAPNTEAELESFRRQWREEVTARAKGKAPAARATAAASKPRGAAPDAALPSHARQRSVEDADHGVPPAYHDLGETQHGPGPRLEGSALQAGHEPSSALEHYEKAVEKESQGSLGDSVNLYRKAFRVSLCILQQRDSAY